MQKKNLLRIDFKKVTVRPKTFRRKTWTSTYVTFIRELFLIYNSKSTRKIELGFISTKKLNFKSKGTKKKVKNQLIEWE
jgi:hypothetical protein